MPKRKLYTSKPSQMLIRISDEILKQERGVGELNSQTFQNAHISEIAPGQMILFHEPH